MLKNKDLKRIREELKEKRSELLATLETETDAGQDDSARNRDRNDLANEYRVRDRRAALRTLDHQTLDQIEHALARIEEGSYGTCEDCGKPIRTERLDFLPQATLCVACQRKDAS